MKSSILSAIRIPPAVRAFANRGVSEGAWRVYLLYSLLIAGGLVAAAYWLVADAAASEAPFCGVYYDYLDVPYHCWQLTFAEVAEVTDFLALLLLMLGGFVAVPLLVAMTLVGENRSGTLEQLRTTPATSSSLIAGFVLGTPLRAYLLLAAPLALHLALGMIGAVSLAATLLSTLLLIVGTLASCAFAAVFALAGERSGGNQLALGAVLLLAVAGLVAFVLPEDRDTIGWAFLHPAGAINALTINSSLIWQDVGFHMRGASWHYLLSPFLSVAFCLAIWMLLGTAAIRRLRRPHEPVLVPLEAIALFVLIAGSFLVPAPIREWRHAATEMMVFFGALLTLVVTVLLVATQESSKAWEASVRRSGSAGIPWRLTLGMLGIAAVLIAFKSAGSRAPDALTLTWLAMTLLTLPLFARFATARFSAGTQRAGFFAGMLVYLIFQFVCIGVTTSRVLDPGELSFLQLGGVIAVSVPGFVWYRLVCLRRRVLAATVS